MINKKMHTRPETFDTEVINEVLTQDIYFKHFPIDKTDKFLDIGTHIGSFIMRCKSAGADVIGFEPEKENFELAKLNTNGYGEIHNKAVVGNNDKKRLLNLYDSSNKGRHSFYKQIMRGLQDVECININDIIADDITGMKIDAEGCEWEIIRAIKDFKNIKKIVFEYHFYLIGKERYFFLIDILEKQGFNVIYEKETTEHGTGIQKAGVVVYANKR